MDALTSISAWTKHSSSARVRAQRANAQFSTRLRPDGRRQEFGAKGRKVGGELREGIERGESRVQIRGYIRLPVEVEKTAKNCLGSFSAMNPPVYHLAEIGVKPDFELLHPVIFQKRTRSHNPNIKKELASK